MTDRHPALTPWLTAQEAAERARVSLKVIYRAVRQDATVPLRVARVGGRRDLRFLPEWVDDWLMRTATPVEVRPLHQVQHRNAPRRDGAA
jgi:hypothetical protein